MPRADEHVLQGEHRRSIRSRGALLGKRRQRGSAPGGPWTWPGLERENGRPEPATTSSRPTAHELAIRAVNILVAVVALLALAPLTLLIAVAIKLDSRGPVLYRQLRVGLDRRNSSDDNVATGRRRNDMGGRPFQIYKFRTMRIDAEDGTGPVWASRNDDRTTRVGRFLRRYRLDEIPQFVNVLKGEMAVVGPRPERPTFVQHLRDELDGYPLRQRVRPGITGWAQVNQQPDQSLDDVKSKLQYDLEYLDHRSLAFDLRIMLKTLPVMLEGQRRNGR